MSKRISNTDLWLHTCRTCDNKWTSKKQWPVTCANTKCRSPYWNKPYTRTDKLKKKKK